jgi:hypothetical protein
MIRHKTLVSGWICTCSSFDLRRPGTLKRSALPSRLTAAPDVDQFDSESLSVQVIVSNHHHDSNLNDAALTRLGSFQSFKLGESLAGSHWQRAVRVQVRVSKRNWSQRAVS